MLRAVNEQCLGDSVPDFIVYANRLFDPNREFDGERGVAYGGPDLSARNLSGRVTLPRASLSGGGIFDEVVCPECIEWLPKRIEFSDEHPKVERD